MNNEFVKDIYGEGAIVRIKEIDVRLPVMPPEKDIINYNLRTDKQKMIRRQVPHDIKRWNQRKINEYAKNEWHIRRNGYWIFIKGEPWYIPGQYDFFYNYWHTEKGGLPEFRIEQLKWFLIWWHIERDPDCYGMFDMKARRGGDTEMALCVVYERTTRARNSRAGIIHVNEEGVQKNFRRIVISHVKMPFFFKPMNIGAVKPVEGPLIFDIPAGQMTTKMVKDGDYDDIGGVGLNSMIMTSPGVTGAYDGDRLNTYYADEIFKVPSHKLDPLKQWDIVKRSLHLYGGDKIIGKAILTSSVEQTESDPKTGIDTVKIASTLWEDSDPANRMPDGRTKSGLYRVFRSFLDSAPVDEWGYPQKERIAKRREQQLNTYKAEGRYDLVIGIYRKEPVTVEEALSSWVGKGVLYPDLCAQQLDYLRVNKAGGYGDLVWKDGRFGGEVVWIPTPNGKWFISQHPVEPNKKIILFGRAYPGNTKHYRCGVDTYDTEGRDGSHGAIVVKRLLDVEEELLAGNMVELGEDGIVRGDIKGMVTNQPVCDYLYRHENPYDFYDDVLKTMFYYGIFCFPETNKDGFRTWISNMGYSNWLQVQPAVLQSKYGRKNQRGMLSNDRTVSLYIDLLKTYISNYVWAVKHERILKQWSDYTSEARSQLDLVAASGYAELASLDHKIVNETTEPSKFEVYEEF